MYDDTALEQRRKIEQGDDDTSCPVSSLHPIVPETCSEGGRSNEASHTNRSSTIRPFEIEFHAAANTSIETGGTPHLPEYSNACRYTFFSCDNSTKMNMVVLTYQKGHWLYMLEPEFP